MTFEVSCTQIRYRGAIGIFFPFSTKIIAESAEKAEEIFREEYETNTPIWIKEIEPEGDEHNGTQETS